MLDSTAQIIIYSLKTAIDTAMHSYKRYRNYLTRESMLGNPLKLCHAIYSPFNGRTTKLLFLLFIEKISGKSVERPNLIVVFDADIKPVHKPYAYYAYIVYFLLKSLIHF